MISVRIAHAAPVIDADEFRQLKSDIDRRLPSGIQAVLFAWIQPYKVACLSLTSAYSLGFDAALCRDTCAPTPLSPYFNAASKRPWDDWVYVPSDLAA